jgi:hypothetical protein
MVIAAGDKSIEGILGSMPAWAVPAIMAQCDGICQSGIRPNAAGDGSSHLGDFESMGQPRALVIGGEYDNLRLPCQPPKGGGVDDAVSISLKTGALRVGLFWNSPLASANGTGSTLAQLCRLPLLCGNPANRSDTTY